MLQTRLHSLELDNPVLSASGTFGSGWEGRQFSDLGMVGGLVSKTVTLAPRPGNPPPRIQETPSGMLNAIGLEHAKIPAGTESFDKPSFLALVEQNR